jgi:hypothetical protein
MDWSALLPTSYNMSSRLISTRDNMSPKSSNDFEEIDVRVVSRKKQSKRFQAVFTTDG